MKDILSLPRLPLGVYPTPFYKLENISARYGKNIWIKRDDLCGVALGGNKVRKLEYLLHDAKCKGYDLVMTTGQAQRFFFKMIHDIPPVRSESIQSCKVVVHSVAFAIMNILIAGR